MFRNIISEDSGGSICMDKGMEDCRKQGESHNLSPELSVRTTASGLKVTRKTER
jgi:hypothetical protein